MERKYYMYQITNKLNGKVYIGVHQTDNLEDGYMGSGTHLKRAQKKYGIENFEKEILQMFDSEEDMYKEEAVYVDREFVLREDTYNLTEGGFGGGLVACIKGGKTCGKYIRDNNIGIFSEENKRYMVSEKHLIHLLECSKKVAESEEIQNKMKATMKKNKHQQGNKNSQFGKMWITDGIISNRINKEDAIPSGWKKGRIIKKK